MGKQRTLLAIVAIIVIGGGALIGATQSTAITRQLHAWKLLPQAEPLTELYFNNSSSLPKTYMAGSTQAVNFTVRNLEYRTLSYSYVITQTSQDGTIQQQLANGSFSLHSNQYSSQKVIVTPADLNRSKITVTISPTGESIYYWINKG